jgi:hypothetical protein
VAAPDAALLSFPEGDFTVSFRAAWWRAPGASPAQAARACAGGRGPEDATSYTLDRALLGITYAVEGVFLPAGDGLLQIEASTPAEKQPFVRELFAAWARAVAGE